MITQEEKQKRQKSWDYVVASIELECGPHIHIFDALMAKYINGDITREEKNKQWAALVADRMKDEEIKEIQYAPYIDAIIETFASYNGYLTTEIRNEENKDQPDKLKLITLKAEKKRVREERSDLLNPDCVSIGRARYIYSPFLKARFQAFKALKDEN